MAEHPALPPAERPPALLRAQTALERWGQAGASGVEGVGFAVELFLLNAWFTLWLLAETLVGALGLVSLALRRSVEALLARIPGAPPMVHRRFPWRRYQDIVAQFYITGIESMFVTLLFALFSGMVLALQAGVELRRVGAEGALGALVTVSMTREMGPMMTAIIITGRVGSAMAAELGTMKVSEEIEALEVMSVHPVRFLVLPRVTALSLMTVVLTVFANIAGIFGGAVVAKYQINVPWELYFKFAKDFFDHKDWWWGMLKAWVFGVGIAIISCGQGLRAANGAAGVGQGTRNAVVQGLMFVVVFNFFLSSVYKILAELFDWGIMSS